MRFHPTSSARALRGWIPVLLAWLALGLATSLHAGSEEVAVVYNLDVSPESRLVAEHYAARRGIPNDRVIGLGLPRGEAMTRAEFRERLQKPLFEELEKRDLVTFHGVILPSNSGQPGQVVRLPVRARIRYLALCYGVPVKILEEAPAPAPDNPAPPKGNTRNEAAVDTELALLPAFDRGLRIAGMVPNPLFRTTNFGQIHPTNGILMVTRLDGPTATRARGLVDQALAAETNGLWGRAYFDARGLTNGPYKLGDDWILGASEVARRHGFETVVDRKDATFGPGFPLPQVALYAGWYDSAPSGPFRLPNVEFVPGAVAYHLYSFSARTIRNGSTWVGALIDKGAAATIGFVNEPYLDGTVELEVWFSRLIESGATLAEASYAALPILSWQTTIIGDPIYRPFPAMPDPGPTAAAAPPKEAAAWRLLRDTNRRLVSGEPPARVADDLARAPDTPTSALLEEKLGDLRESAGDLTAAAEAYRRALKLKPTPQQRLRLQLGQARFLTAAGRAADAIDVYEQFVKENPKYPDLIEVYRLALGLAQQLNKPSLIRRYEAEIQYLTPPPPATNAPPKGTKP